MTRSFSRLWSSHRRSSTTSLHALGRSLSAFLLAGIVLWLVSLLTTRHHLLAGPLHVVLVLIFACLLLASSEQGKVIRANIAQLRKVWADQRPVSGASSWWRNLSRTSGIVVGERRKDG